MTKIKSDWEFDFFISHAHEDKSLIARPLALALRRKGMKVWYDEFSLKLGDSLLESITKGLANSHYGILILSHSFFKKKKWTKTELRGLLTDTDVVTGKKIIPIWHHLSPEDVRRYSPILADYVAISTETPLPEIVDRILSEVHEGQQEVDLSKFAPTGITRLDQALRGGLHRSSSIMIQGPQGIGKTTLAAQIQLAALDRGEPGVYITYREAPIDIILMLQRLGAPLETFINKNKFKILDNYSALAGLSKQEVLKFIPEVLKPAVVSVDDPYDKENYYKIQVELIESMGERGVNIIDATNERFQMLQKSKNDSPATRQYFQKFRSRLGRMGGYIGIHLVNEIYDDENFRKMLANFEDGIIKMFYKKSQGERTKYIKVDSMRDGPFDNKEMEFVITADGIKIF